MSLSCSFWMEPICQIIIHLFRKISFIHEYQHIITFLNISDYLLGDYSRIMHE